MVMRIKPSDVEREAHAFSAATVERACAYLRTEGTLIIEDIIDQNLIEETRRAFHQKYSSHINRTINPDVLFTVGEKRLMIMVNFESPFDEPELFANSWLRPILMSAFDDEVVLDAFGVVCSLPGAPAQYVHQDGADMFPQRGLNRLLPVVAMTCAIPLIEMNQSHGTTALWPGSHRDEGRDPVDGADLAGEEPIVRTGSCVLWDYRLRHGGTANRSNLVRPLLYLTYCRPWFVDHKNYATAAGRHPSGRRLPTALRAPKGFTASVRQELRYLLGRVQEYPAQQSFNKND